MVKGWRDKEGGEVDIEECKGEWRQPGWRRGWGRGLEELEEQDLVLQSLERITTRINKFLT